MPDRQFDRLDCESTGGKVVEYGGVQACAYPSTRGAVSYFALGTGAPLATIEATGEHRGESSSGSGMLWLLLGGLALLLFGRRGSR